MNNLPEVRSVWRRVILIVGYTFLYAPMLMLVIYSFNSSKTGHRVGGVVYPLVYRAV